MLKDDSKAMEKLADERPQQETGLQEWQGGDAPGYVESRRETPKDRLPSTLERPAVEPPRPEAPAETEKARGGP